MDKTQQKRAVGVGLFSGGLDSILAARILMDQGIEVVLLSFQTPFFGLEHAIKAAEELGVELIVQDITFDHLAVVRNPRYGYGANMNPCIDCHGLMAQKAGELMQAEGHDFIFTGEVLNERPMSQTRNSLRAVAKLSGYADVLLRPLSAKLLPETRPEQEGRVDRERLLDLQGRSRKRQLDLMKRYGLKEYPNPAGGCLLTDPNFSRRLKELFRHHPDCGPRDLELLKVGRHFRIDGVKVVVGRNEKENQRLKALAGEMDALLSAEHIPGPIALVCGDATAELLHKAAGICMRYSDDRGRERPGTVFQILPREQVIDPLPLLPEEIEGWII